MNITLLRALIQCLLITLLESLVEEVDGAPNRNKDFQDPTYDWCNAWKTNSDELLNAGKQPSGIVGEVGHESKVHKRISEENRLKEDIRQLLKKRSLNNSLEGLLLRKLNVSGSKETNIAIPKNLIVHRTLQKIVDPAIKESEKEYQGRIKFTPMLRDPSEMEKDDPLKYPLLELVQHVANRPSLEISQNSDSRRIKSGNPFSIHSQPQLKVDGVSKQQLNQRTEPLKERNCDENFKIILNGIKSGLISSQNDEKILNNGALQMSSGGKLIVRIEDGKTGIDDNTMCYDKNIPFSPGLYQALQNSPKISSGSRNCSCSNEGPSYGEAEKERGLDENLVNSNFLNKMISNFVEGKSKEWIQTDGIKSSNNEFMSDPANRFKCNRTNNLITPVNSETITGSPYLKIHVINGPAKLTLHTKPLSNSKSQIKQEIAPFPGMFMLDSNSSPHTHQSSNVSNLVKNYSNLKNSSSQLTKGLDLYDKNNVANLTDGSVNEKLDISNFIAKSGKGNQVDFSQSPWLDSMKLQPVRILENNPLFSSDQLKNSYHNEKNKYLVSDTDNDFNSFNPSSLISKTRSFQNVNCNKENCSDFVLQTKKCVESLPVLIYCVPVVNTTGTMNQPIIGYRIKETDILLIPSNEANLDFLLKHANTYSKVVTTSEPVQTSSNNIPVFHKPLVIS